MGGSTCTCIHLRVYHTVYWEISVSLNFREKIFSRMIHICNIKGVAGDTFAKFNFVTEQNL